MKLPSPDALAPVSVFPGLDYETNPAKPFLLGSDLQIGLHRFHAQLVGLRTRL